MSRKITKFPFWKSNTDPQSLSARAVMAMKPDAAATLALARAADNVVILDERRGPENGSEPLAGLFRGPSPGSRLR